jgi:hypothetical protein
MVGATVVFSTILLSAYISLLLIVNSARFQEWMAKEIANRTGYDFSARDMRLDPLLRLTFTEVKASSAARLSLQAQRVIVVPSPAILFSRSIYRLQLEKPVLIFELDQLLDSTKKESVNVSIRRLIIQDGTLVVGTGEGREIDFRSVAMSAENINLGQGIGVNLRAAVPWLDGIAAVTILGNGNESEAVIRFEQSGGRGITELIQGKGREVVESKIKLTRIANEPIRISAQGKLNGMRIADESFSGTLSASAEIKPDLRDAVFSAAAVATRMPSKLPFLPVPVPEGTATLTLRGVYEFAAKNLYFQSLELQSPLGDAKGQGQISFTPAAAWKNTRVSLRKVALENLKPILPSPMNTIAHGGSAEADLEISGPWRSASFDGSARVSGVKLQHKQFSLSEVDLETPVRWTDDSFRAGDIQLSGRKILAQLENQMKISADTVRVTGTLDKKKDEAVKAAGTVLIHQGAFASGDGSKMGEKLSLAARFASIEVRDGDSVSLAGKVDIEQGEVLWGKFYGDLKSQQPTLELKGEYRRNADLLRVHRAYLALGSIGHVTIHGEFAELSKDPIVRVEIKSADIQSSGLFEFFIRETLNRSYPMLDRLTIGGLVSISAKASGALSQVEVEGTLTLHKGDVRAKSNNWHVAGIELNLPLRVHYPAGLSNTTPANVATGIVTIESAKFGMEVITAIKTTVSLWNNVLRFHQPIRLPISGGLLEIFDLAWEDVIATPQAVSLSIEARNLQLQQFTEALGWYRFGGTLSGSIPKIEWTGASLHSQGQIDIAVFGGRLRLSQLEIEAPFSSVPSIKLDARFQDIQLEQASETFAFGRISGVLAGTINDLVVTKSQPSNFTADIYSVDKDGISQRISVESLNKITVLSSGEDAGTLYGGIAGFFDSFRYSKLGFKATLKNDKLTLRGVETRDGQEYLVVGSLIPPTVNVISHTQEIAFAELVRRLERIQKSETGPKTAH